MIERSVGELMHIYCVRKNLFQHLPYASMGVQSLSDAASSFYRLVVEPICMWLLRKVVILNKKVSIWCLYIPIESYCIELGKSCRPIALGFGNTQRQDVILPLRVLGIEEIFLRCVRGTAVIFHYSKGYRRYLIAR